MLAGKNKKYVRLGNKNLVGAADTALGLTTRGKGRQFIAGALGGGIAEGVFVGDAEKIGSAMTSHKDVKKINSLRRN